MSTWKSAFELPPEDPNQAAPAAENAGQAPAASSGPAGKGPPRTRPERWASGFDPYLGADALDATGDHPDAPEAEPRDGTRAKRSRHETSFHDRAAEALGFTLPHSNPPDHELTFLERAARVFGIYRDESVEGLETDWEGISDHHEHATDRDDAADHADADHADNHWGDGEEFHGDDAHH